MPRSPNSTIAAAIGHDLGHHHPVDPVHKVHKVQKPQAGEQEARAFQMPGQRIDDAHLRRQGRDHDRERGALNDSRGHTTEIAQIVDRADDGEQNRCGGQRQKHDDIVARQRDDRHGRPGHCQDRDDDGQPAALRGRIAMGRPLAGPHQ